jgi:hypothetical protein
MIHLLITVDYEVFANGGGDVDELLLQPTARLLQLAGTYNAKLTFFFEVCEFWAFQEARRQGRLTHLDYDPAAEMQRQMQAAVAAGHDAQLHAHPQWTNSSMQGTYWELDRTRVRLPSLPPHEIRDLLSAGKRTLEDMLRPVKTDYRCIAFRAGELCIQPEKEVLGVLAELGFLFDSSVEPGFWCLKDPVFYDFRGFLERPFWRVSDSLNKENPQGDIWELPITTRRMHPWQRDLFSKVRKMLPSRSATAAHVMTGYADKGPTLLQTLSSKHYRLDLADSARSSQRMLEAVMQEANGSAVYPVVAIGHPFALAPSREIKRFFRYCEKQASRGALCFSSFKELFSALDRNAEAPESMPADFGA